jgi:hypothetical protein
MGLIACRGVGRFLPSGDGKATAKENEHDKGGNTAVLVHHFSGN